MRYATEFIGTFFLALVGLHVGTFTTSLMLAALTFMGCRISQAHYNPAVTVAHLVRKSIALEDALWYMLWQILGATFAVVVSASLLDTAPVLATAAISLSFAPVYQPLVQI